MKLATTAFTYFVKLSQGYLLAAEGNATLGRGERYSRPQVMLLAAASKRLCRIQEKVLILLRRVFKIQKNLCMIFDQIAWRLRHS